MRKALNILVVVLIVSLIVGTVVYAAEARMTNVTLNLTFEGTTANCVCTVVDGSKSIKVTLELWDGSTRVGSWTKSGTGYISFNETCGVTKGNTCTLSASGTIDGVPFTSHSVSKDCK